MRLILSPPTAPAMNMAVDEMLLGVTAETGESTFRIYTWERPTLSLGYFQGLAERDAHTESRNCALVRRATGGGAILHHHEITYSYATPTKSRWGAAATKLYDLVHESLVQLLGEFGVQAGLFPCDQCEASQNEQPFLCFERRAGGDIVTGGYKVVGSAQRRRQGAVLQHGSILIDRSEFAPSLPGINDIAGLSLTADELTSAWLKILPKALGLEGSSSNASLVEGELTSDELGQAEEIASSKFAAAAWTAKR